MQMDLYFYILTTCMHLMSGAKFDHQYELTKQCQAQLTSCHAKIRELRKDVSEDAIVGYCLMHEVDFKLKNK
jgi:hypothetical protein